MQRKEKKVMSINNHLQVIIIVVHIIMCYCVLRYQYDHKISQLILPCDLCITYLKFSRIPRHRPLNLQGARVNLRQAVQRQGKARKIMLNRSLERWQVLLKPANQRKMHNLHLHPKQVYNHLWEVLFLLGPMHLKVWIRVA